MVPHAKDEPGANKIKFRSVAVDAPELQVQEEASFFVPR
jgi:hypothetical protein